jgi:arylsulfatase A-like enzyme
MIYNLDQNIGRLLQALEHAGKADNTIVIFTSDNGGLATSEGSSTCNAPLAEGKGWVYDGGVRVPLLVRWPQTVRSGALCETPVTSPDFFPTLLDAAGVDAPPVPEGTLGRDGISFASLLREEAEWEPRAIFWHYPHYGNQGGTPASSVRIGDWKLIEFFEDSHLELYDLRMDEGETDNRAAAEPERAAHMQQILAQWRRDVEAKIPAPNPDYT